LSSVFASMFLSDRVLSLFSYRLLVRHLGDGDRSGLIVLPGRHDKFSLSA